MRRLMKSTKKSIALFLGLLLLNTSCIENVISDFEPIELLAGTWLVQGGTVYLPGSGSLDLFEGLEACEKDDLLIFTSFGVYQREEGLLSCDDQSNPVFESGTFQLAGNSIFFVSQDEQIIQAQYSVRFNTLTLTYQSEGVILNFVYARI